MNFGKQTLVSLVLFYSIPLLFACETFFLGFGLDLLVYEFLVIVDCWNFTSRNTSYSYFSLIYFAYTDSCSLPSVISYLDSLGKNSGYSGPKTRSFRAYTRSIRAESMTDRFLSVFELQIAYSPPSRHLKVLSIGIRAWLSILRA